MSPKMPNKGYAVGRLLSFIFEKTAEVDFDKFYILGCIFFKCGPIIDFSGSPKNWDPEDFKSGFRKAIKRLYSLQKYV